MEKLYYLVSNSGDPDNTRTHFKCYLPQKIDNQGSLSVKLLNLSLENSYFTFHHQASQPSLILTYPPEIKLPWSFIPHNTDYVKHVITFASIQQELHGYVTTFIYLTDTRCTSLEELVTVINTSLTSCRLDKYVRLITSRSDVLNEEKTVIKLLNRVSSIAVSSVLAEVLGFDTTDAWNMSKVNNLVDSDHHLPKKLQNKNLNPMYIFNNNARNDSHHATMSFNNTLFIPRTVNVEIEEVEQIISSSGFCNTVNILPGAGQNNSSISSYSPLTPIDRHINEPSLSCLTFRLSDSFTKDRILFSQGAPSYATVAISQQQKMATNQQLITVFSNDKHSLQLSPNNKNTHFTTHLPKHLNIGQYSSWSLKLLSFSFSAEICNLSSSQTYFDVYETIKNQNQHLFRCKFKSGKYHSMEQLIDTINKTLSFHEENIHKLYFSYDDAGYVTIHNGGTRPCMIDFNIDLSNVLGTTFDKPQVSIKRDSSLKLPRLSDVDVVRPRYLKILCRETEHTFFAGERAQVFSFFSIDAAQKSSKISNFYEFLDPPRVSVATHYLSELTFTVTTGLSSSPVELEDDYNTPTYLVLALERHNPL